MSALEIIVAEASDSRDIDTGAVAELSRILATSGSPVITAARLGIHQTTMYRRIKQYGIELPNTWHDRGMRILDEIRIPVPLVILSDPQSRVFVGTMIGTEGCITCSYNKRQDHTELVIRLDMTDREWVAKFASAVGLRNPPAEGRHLGGNHSPTFTRNPMGLRALRILNEVLPFLYGVKKEEALRAIEFFSPTGYRKGVHRPAEIFANVTGRSGKSKKSGPKRPSGGLNN